MTLRKLTTLAFAAGMTMVPLACGGDDDVASEPSVTTAAPVVTSAAGGAGTTGASAATTAAPNTSAAVTTAPTSPSTTARTSSTSGTSTSGTTNAGTSTAGTNTSGTNTSGTTTSGTTTSGPSTTVGPVTGGDLDKWCKVWDELDAIDAFNDNATPTPTEAQAQFEELQGKIGELSRASPNEIKADVDKVSSGFDQLKGVLAANGYDTKTFDTSPDAKAVFADKEFEAAGDRMNAFEKAHCPA